MNYINKYWKNTARNKEDIILNPMYFTYKLIEFKKIIGEGMTNKEKYIELCNSTEDINIFSQPWWLDAVCESENWDVILYENGGKVLASLPYYFYYKGHKKLISQPLLTQKNGIYIKYPNNQKKTSRISYERKAIRTIIDSLENLGLASYKQNYDYTFSNWLPFYWKGFQQTTRYTYIIEGNDIDNLYQEIDSTTKNQIRKAQKIVEVKEDLNIEEFYNINKMTFERKNMKIPYSLKLVKNIDIVCEKKKCRKIFYAEDELKNIHAAIYLVWDNKSVYYIMGGINPEFKKSEATSLLMWEAIKFSTSINRVFDFEGSMNESIEKFFSSFGSEQKPYFSISKSYCLNFKDFLIYIYMNSAKIKAFYKKIKK